MRKFGTAPSRRDMLRGVAIAAAAAPAAAVPAIAAGDDSEVHAAIEAFHQVKAERAAALKRAEGMRGPQQNGFYAEIREITRRYDDAALAAYRARPHTLKGIAAKLDFHAIAAPRGRIRAGNTGHALNKACKLFCRELREDLLAIIA